MSAIGQLKNLLLLKLKLRNIINKSKIMKRTAVINVVALSHSLVGKHTPFLTEYLAKHGSSHIKPVVPAVTCSVQATYLTGVMPSQHGIVGNGWYFKDEHEVKFWRQSNALVQAPKIWDYLKSADANATTANLFWWYNMYSSVDYSVTPRPQYPADGRKLPDVYTQPASLRTDLQAKLGQFPLFKFWGPAADWSSTQWIIDSAIAVENQYSPTLSLVYLPHLDYCLQQFGPNHDQIATELARIDAGLKQLVSFYEERGIAVVLLSEYGIGPVSQPVHLNRVLRQAGYLAVRKEQMGEQHDPGASLAFAVADHQVAHIYVKDASKLAEIRQLIASVPGVDQVWTADEIAAHGLTHERCGDLVAIAKPDAWFTYYYWLDDQEAPDWARTVDIHRKPGYDPVELFTQKSKAYIAGVLLKRKLGFKALMDITPLDASLVKGSHGILPPDRGLYPLLCTNQAIALPETLQATEVFQVLRQVLGV